MVFSLRVIYGSSYSGGKDTDGFVFAGDERATSRATAVHILGSSLHLEGNLHWTAVTSYFYTFRSLISQHRADWEWAVS